MTIFLLLAMLAGPGAGAAAPGDLAWFQATEQALMDAMATGDKAVWQRVMDSGFVMTGEEGEVLTRQQFLDGLRGLPSGLSGKIVVRDLTAQEFPSLAVVRYLADESESVFGQMLAVRYRVTDTYRRDGDAWKLVASHLSVVTADPPAQQVSQAAWPGLVGTYRLLPDGWSFTVALRDGKLMGGRDPGQLRPFVALTPDAFVLSGRLGEWLFVVEAGKATKLVNLRKFATLVWTRVESGS